MTETKPQPAKKKKVRSYSVNDIINWKFAPSPMPEAWEKHLGNIDSRFTMYIDGEPGNGKTEYVMQMIKMLTNHVGKTRINNVEQGKHTQIKTSVIRNNYKDSIPVGKFQYDMIRNYEDFKAKIKKPNSGHVIIIDSISYWPLTLAQVQELIDTFKKKSFVFVAYKAAFTRNQPIIHNCDIKIRVEKFIAHTVGSRFGGTEDYAIWPEQYPLPIKKQIMQTGNLFEHLNQIDPEGFTKQMMPDESKQAE